MSIEHIYELLKDVNDRDQYVKRGELIRCRECKHYSPYICKAWSKYGTITTEPEGYCYKAERRTE